MIDNAYNRNKMRGFVMGLEAAKHMVQAGDDVQIFQAQVDERIEEICEDWNIKPPAPEGNGDDYDNKVECPTCHGKGEVYKKTGVMLSSDPDLWATKPCPECKGTGKIDNPELLPGGTEEAA